MYIWSFLLTGAGLGAVLGAGLDDGLGAGLDDGLGAGLGASLGAGLGAGLGGGLGVGPGGGLETGLLTCLPMLGFDLLAILVWSFLLIPDGSCANTRKDSRTDSRDFCSGLGLAIELSIDTCVGVSSSFPDVPVGFLIG